MKKDDNEKIFDAVYVLTENACRLLNDNYKILLEILQNKSLLTDDVVKKLSLYSSSYNDTRGRILKNEIMEIWQNNSEFKLISKSTMLNKFSDIWHKLKSSGYHFQIDGTIFKMLIWSNARGYVNEMKIIDFCHLDETTETYSYNPTNVKAYILTQILKKKQRNTKDNNDKKEEIEK